MTTIINSNGSKWAGQEPDPINTLVEVLATVPLDRTFETYGNFYQPTPNFCGQFGEHNHGSEFEGLPCFSGNFFSLSHVFCIYTDDYELISRLLTAIDINQHRPDYLSQDKPANRDHPFNKDCRCIDCRYEANRETCPVCLQLKGA